MVHSISLREALDCCMPHEDTMKRSPLQHSASNPALLRNASPPGSGRQSCDQQESRQHSKESRQLSKEPRPLSKEEMSKRRQNAVEWFRAARTINKNRRNSHTTETLIADAHHRYKIMKRQGYP